MEVLKAQNLNELCAYGARFHMFIAETTEAQRCMQQAHQQKSSTKQSSTNSMNI
jgi:hypothetical protein